MNDVSKCTLGADAELEAASIAGDVNKVKEVLDRGGVNVNNGVLHKACIHGHTEVVALLLQRGANPELKLASGETCLHLAAFHGQLDVLKYLLEHNANLYNRTKDGKTALLLAVSQNYSLIANELLKCTAPHYSIVNDSDAYGNTPLILVTMTTHCD